MATDPETNYPLAILVLSPLKSFTGNLITAERIRKYFRNHRIFGFVKDPREFATLEAFHGFLELYQVATVIAIHAIHCGKLLQDCPVPYAVIFGGTDVNHDGVNADCFLMMTDVVINARKLVAFTDLMARQVLELWPDDISTDKIEVIPQGVKLNPSELFSISAHLKLVFSVTCEKPEIYMLVAGVRPVKDPLYLAEAFSDWHCSVNSKAYLVIVGPPLDEDYLNQFQAVVSRLPGVLFIPGLQHSDMQAAIRDSHALINSSRSEGQSVAILEAMAFGTPVIARRIAANKAIVSHCETGLLYDSPQDFLLRLTELNTAAGLREKVCENARRLIADRHTTDNEEAMYIALLKKLLPGATFAV